MRRSNGFVIWLEALSIICHTTKDGVYTVLHPSLSRWFRTDDDQLQYRRLPHNMCSEKLFATRVSRRGNMGAQYLPPNLVGHAHSQ